jgi:peptidoglycan/xylan/chitin deacetylase (PgdA/CDA1 family)
MMSSLASYFRPLYGTLGARTRRSLLRHIPAKENPTIVRWSVDVEDWKWGESDTPEKQMEAFKRQVEKGGDLVVLYYLYGSAVGYLREMIWFVKEMGLRVGTVGECLRGDDE